MRNDPFYKAVASRPLPSSQPEPNTCDSCGSHPGEIVRYAYQGDILGLCDTCYSRAVSETVPADALIRTVPAPRHGPICATCSGCDHADCRARCHGETFGVHVDYDA